MEQTTSRLRKTFRYPADDSDDDSAPEAMDEQEQERLIADLASQNASLNRLYARVLLALPLICILPYLPALPALSSLLSVSSLLSTAYLVLVLEEGETAIGVLDRLSNARAKESGRRTKHVHFESESPIRQYLPYLNIGLCGVLVLLGRLQGGEAALSWLPGAVYAIVLCGKWIMGSVDPGRELNGLRYGFKGA